MHTVASLAMNGAMSRATLVPRLSELNDLATNLREEPLGHA
jgi:hypothetical protein